MPGRMRLDWKRILLSAGVAAMSCHHHTFNERRDGFMQYLKSWTRFSCKAQVPEESSIGCVSSCTDFYCAHEDARVQNCLISVSFRAISLKAINKFLRGTARSSWTLAVLHLKGDLLIESPNTDFNASSRKQCWGTECHTFHLDQRIPRSDIVLSQINTLG